MAMQNSSPLQNERRLVAGLRLALEGNCDQAEALLREADESSLDASSLDLLARIAFARGDEVEARRLWQLALAREGDCAPAQAALATMDSLWRTAALAKLGGIVLGGALLLTFAGLGVHSVVYPKSVQAVIPATPAPESAALAAAVAPPVRWPVGQLTGFAVAQRPDSLTLIPTNPIFTSRCELAATAAADLQAVASVMKGELRNCSVTIVGQTDTRSVRSDSTFRDNYNLGWHRAVTVADYLRRVHGVPPHRISATSAGVSPGEPGPGTTATRADGGRTVAFRFDRLPEAR